MYFSEEKGVLIAKYQNEKIAVEAWGNNALRVRATYNPDFTGSSNALEEISSNADITILEEKAIIVNGKIKCIISENGWIEFYNKSKLILKEYYRDFRGANEHSPSMKFYAREFKPVSGSDYSITVRFEAQNNEKIYGMGQYQQPNLDLKGCILELAYHFIFQIKVMVSCGIMQESER